MEYLISEGSNINENDEEVLKESSAYNQLKIVKYLISKGSNFHAENDESLKRSAMYGCLKVVKYLIEKGCDINVAKKFGRYNVLNWIKEKETKELAQHLNLNLSHKITSQDKTSNLKI